MASNPSLPWCPTSVLEHQHSALLTAECKMLGNDPCGGFLHFVWQNVLFSSEVPKHQPPSPPHEGFPSMRKLFPLNDSLPRAQVPCPGQPLSVSFVSLSFALLHSEDIGIVILKSGIFLLAFRRGVL